MVRNKSIVECYNMKSFISSISENFTNTNKKFTAILLHVCTHKSHIQLTAHIVWSSMQPSRRWSGFVRVNN